MATITDFLKQSGAATVGDLTQGQQLDAIRQGILTDADVSVANQQKRTELYPSSGEIPTFPTTQKVPERGVRYKQASTGVTGGTGGIVGTDVLTGKTVQGGDAGLVKFTSGDVRGTSVPTTNTTPTGTTPSSQNGDQAGITDFDLESTGIGTVGFDPETQKLIAEQNRLAQERAASEKAKQAGIAEGLVSGTGITDVVTPTPGTFSAKVLSAEENIIEKQANLKKDQLDQQLINTRSDLVFGANGRPISLTPASEDRIAQPYSRAIEMSELQKAEEIALKDQARLRYENEMNRNITVAENAAIEEDMRLRSQAAMNGWTYNSTAQSAMRNQVRKTNDSLNYMRTTLAQESKFMDEQVSFIQQRWNQTILGYTEQMEQAKYEHFVKLVDKTREIEDDILATDLEKEEARLEAQKRYVENYSKEQERTLELVEALSKKTADDASWFDNRKELPVFDGKNYRDNGDGTVTFAWLNKENGEIEFSTQETGLSPSATPAMDLGIEALVNRAKNPAELKTLLDLGEYSDAERKVAVSSFLNKEIGQPAQIIPSQQEIDDFLFKYNQVQTPSDQDAVLEEGIEKFGIGAIREALEVPADVQDGIIKATAGLPTKIRDSEKEMARFVKVAVPKLRAGQDPLDIADEFQGFDLNGMSQDQKALARNLRLYATDTDVDLPDIARLIKNNDINRAMTVIENANLEEQDIAFAGVADASDMVKRINEALADFEGVDPDLIGAFDAKKAVFENTVGNWFTDQEDLDKANALNAKLTAMIAPFRNQLLGSAVTTNESEFLKPLLPSLTDQPELIKVKLEEFRDSILNSHNSARRATNLPEVNDQSLLSNSARVKLYEGMGQSPSQTYSAPTQTMSDIDWLRSQGATEEQIQQLTQENFLQLAPSGGAAPETDGKVQPQDLQFDFTGDKLSLNVADGQVVGGSTQGNDGQCGLVYNQISKKIGTNERVGDTVASKRRIIKKDSPNIPEVGGAFISLANPRYGHIGIVTEKSFIGEPKEGDRIAILDSNRVNDRKASNRILIYKDGQWTSSEFGDEKIDGFGKGLQQFSNYA